MVPLANTWSARIRYQTYLQERGWKDDDDEDDENDSRIYIALKANERVNDKKTKMEYG